MEPDEVADAIGVVLVGRLPHGANVGAYAVRTADGVDAVLKVGVDDAGESPLVAALRARGYPIPAVLSSGSAGGAQTSPGALERYAAHLVQRQVDWSVRHDPSSVEWFMGIGDALLGSTAQIRRPGA